MHNREKFVIIPVLSWRPFRLYFNIWEIGIGIL